MNVAIHQPQYLPWLPYFLKADDCDTFIFLDNVDFQKNGLHNRNQIKTAQGAQWLTVPVKQRLGQRIDETGIDNSTDWRRKHWQTLRQCYGKAPFFSRRADELEALYAREWHLLCELNIELTRMMMQWLGVQPRLLRSSAMQARGTASELVLNLCLEAGADRYISGTGGMNYLRTQDFEQAGVEIDFLPPVLPGAYPQLFPQAGHFPDLSALDVILNCGDAWRDHLPAKACTI